MDEQGTLPPHPYGVKPLGNAYAHTETSHNNAFLQLPDEVLVETLECLDAKSLARIGATCKSLLAFARSEEIWKALYLS